MRQYIINVVDRLLKEKEQTSSDAVVTYSELMTEINEDVLEIMRELHRQRIYSGRKTINSIAFRRWSDT